MSAQVDGNDQIDAYCDYIAASPLGDPAEFIADTWLDQFKLVDDRYAQTAAQRLANLRKSLLFVLRATCTDLELATNAARLGGEVDFSDWLEGSNV